MTEYTLTDGDTEYATIQTTPFAVTLTEAGRDSDALAAFQDEYESVRGELQEEDQLALGEEWIPAPEGDKKQLIRRIARARGWGVVLANRETTDA